MQKLGKLELNCKYFNALNALNALTGFMLMNRNMINVGLFSAYLVIFS